jgi:hypothetical protein
MSYNIKMYIYTHKNKKRQVYYAIVFSYQTLPFLRIKFEKGYTAYSYNGPFAVMQWVYYRSGRGIRALSMRGVAAAYVKPARAVSL